MKRMRPYCLAMKMGACLLLVLSLSQCAERTNGAMQQSRVQSVKSQAMHSAVKQPKRVAASKTSRAKQTNNTVAYNPDAANLNVQLGMGYLQNGNVQRAQMKLQQALKQAPEDVTVINALAYFYSQTGQLDKSKKYYLLALKKHPHSGLAHNNYGVFLCQHDDQYSAISHFVLATQDSDYLKSAEAFENAGLCSMKLKQTGRAWEFFQLAHQRDPQRASVLLELARLSYQEGQLDRAKRYLDGFEKIAGPTGISNHMSGQISSIQKRNTTTAPTG